MMLDISTPALVFPATTLLILAYTHRFAHLSDHIRQFAEMKKTHDDEVIEAQLDNFHRRIHLVQRTEAFGVLGLIMSLLSSLALFSNAQEVGMICFVMSISFILLSLTFALWEIMLSTAALHVVLATQTPKEHKLRNFVKRFVPKS
jgi:hypothetical protein